MADRCSKWAHIHHGYLNGALRYFLCEDPPRGHADGHAANGGKQAASGGLRGMWRDVKEILRVKSFIWNTLGFCCVSFAAGEP